MEVEAAVAAYRGMLILQLAGENYNKSQRNVALQKITSRSKGSIERKHQNISAILNNGGFYYIPGYKPLGNYQRVLEEVVTARILDNPDIQELAAKSAVRDNFQLAMPADILSICVAPPEPPLPGDSLYRRVAEGPQERVLPRRDYLALEARNAALGSSGEDLVMHYEHQRLWTEGARHLADRIERVSVTKGDSLGYDILSFDADGRERLIEVKTTQSGPLAAFYVSANEVRVSAERSDQYHLYRVYDFLGRKSPKLFLLQGSLGRTCQLDAVAFRGRVK